MTSSLIGVCTNAWVTGFIGIKRYGDYVKARLQQGKELPLVEALIQAGADLDFQSDRDDGKKSDTPLIGAASLAAQDVGLRLLDAGARPELCGLFGETALHWAALLGEDRLVGRLIEGSDLDLDDEKYHSPPLGWAIHGR